MAEHLSVGVLVLAPDGRMLLLRRAASESFLPGYWELPGGRIEPGETPRVAAQRELNEETGLTDIVSKESLHTFAYETIGGSARQVDFLVRSAEEHPEVTVSDEHDEFIWVTSDEFERLEDVDNVLRRAVRRAASHADGVRLVAFEGIDAVGKTRMIAEVAADLANASFNVKILDEFPTDFADGYLDNLVRHRQFLDLHPTFPTPIAQTLVIASSHAYKVESVFDSSDGPCLLLADRYLASVVAYQTVVLREHGYTDLEIRNLMRALAGLFRQPDLMFMFERGADDSRMQRSMRGDPVNIESDLFLARVAHEYPAALAIWSDCQTETISLTGVDFDSARQAVVDRILATTTRPNSD